MASSTLMLFLLVLYFSFQFSSSLDALNKGYSSLSVDKAEQDVIVSENGMFSAGFFEVGDNAFSFAIWFTRRTDSQNITTPTVVWMANRDQPVNGKRSKISLLHTGNLALVDAGQFQIWSSETESYLPTELRLGDDGNLVLRELQGGRILWQSFDFPTDTLLPGQHLTRSTQLVSSRTESNHSSGFYKLSFDNRNVLTLLYDGPDVSSTYWPDLVLRVWEAGRFTYNSSRIAVLNPLGHFDSSDNYSVRTSDYGVMLPRRLTIDHDGNLRVYSQDLSQKWYVSMQAISNSCSIHGICGANSVCRFDSKKGRKCSCVPGYKVKNQSDWSYGCESIFSATSNESDFTFLGLDRVEFYGYDYNFIPNCTYTDCENGCLNSSHCKGFQYSYDNVKGVFKCYQKRELLNGHLPGAARTITYLKVPKGKSFPPSYEDSVIRNSDCSVKIHREYLKKHVSHFVSFLLWFAAAIGVLEMTCIFVVLFLIKCQHNSSIDPHGHHLAAVGFRKFSYSELKKATKGFSQEIGRGAGGTVYKALLSDQRIAAVKKLNDAKQGEGEFLAEASIIGRLNHMNLIEMWGYCAEGKHRLLVYEYMENGSLADNLSSNTLDWSKRYNIALGTARGLAYLHEECLEWILHCDIKPQNILLDSNYQPKVADFGLSKLLNRDVLTNNPNFSMIRGTRGYMAPEWVFNLAVTSKVDVYSYGIVLLEMITGKNPTADIQAINGEEPYNGRLVTWVREKRRECASWVEQILDSALGSNYDENKMDILARVALGCIEEDKEERPTMSQVVEVLQNQDCDPNGGVYY
ncbi:putative receptor protein kinase ZmPK1 [Arachis ipaensis]|uniref:putative receptor protein kinase ZmPK1 n=1 Tax=Arachis ipaensis TaxID=130454 RepID=UPI0007AF6F80|nr:putative receptor protein kinase ZmPK1 [Arachis ipaensis]XP_025633299.1 putative receptor protein kinase ZmPK1 [Arachis hypogaea]QHO24247.1 Putative receptor protein kinase [Arachis hypogaea]